jgi:hypothetical protein
MAKLSAHGDELVRAHKELEQDKYGVVKSIYTKSYRSDGKILQKIKSFWADGMTHDYGWKLKGKLKPGLSVGDIATALRNSGWTIDYAMATEDGWRS